MAVTVHSIAMIVSNPAVRAGRPVIAGTGIRVSDIAAMSVIHGQSPDEVALAYGLSLSQVHAALAFYYEHKADIDDEIRRDDALIQSAKEQSSGQRPQPLP